MTTSNGMPTITDTQTDELPEGGPSEGFIADAEAVSVADAPPELIPPEESAAAGERGVTAWLTNTRIIGVWSNSSNKNSFINIKDVGWRRLNPAGENAVVAMTMLASHARADGRNVTVRVESDNLVHELYVW